MFRRQFAGSRLISQIVRPLAAVVDADADGPSGPVATLESMGASADRQVLEGVLPRHRLGRTRHVAESARRSSPNRIPTTSNRPTALCQDPEPTVAALAFFCDSVQCSFILISLSLRWLRFSMVSQGRTRKARRRRSGCGRRSAPSGTTASADLRISEPFQSRPHARSLLPARADQPAAPDGSASSHRAAARRRDRTRYRRGGTQRSSPTRTAGRSVT